MPRLSPQTKLLRDQEFLTAYQETGSLKEAAKKVSKIGSQGAKDPERSAEAAGSQRLRNIELSILEAAAENGITPTTVAKKIKELLDDKDLKNVDKGITHSLKIGVGGGYTPEAPPSVTFNVALFNNPQIRMAVGMIDQAMKGEIIKPIANAQPIPPTS